MKKYKALAGYIVLAVTIGLFIYYIIKYPQYWHELKNLHTYTIALLLFLYLLFLGASILILKYTVEYCGKVIGYKNNLQLSAYSAIINFLGPLQSGPGFRAIYLRNNYKIALKSFFGASVLYYLSFAAISAICIVIGSSYWRWTIVLGPLIILFAYSVYKWDRKRQDNKNMADGSIDRFNKIVASKIALATLLQVIVVVIIYFTEIKTVNHLISFRQAIAYTGVANFALFVSITPGAIGIREAFLLFSQHLLHMPSKTIINASIIDRAIYLVFLGILFIFVASLHINKKLNTKKLTKIT
jgi:uncharacterized membrane protein YbhN (UPF0104 family)